MSITPDEITLLVELVTAEYGEHAVAHVDAYVNALRKDGEKESVSLWSKVLAMLSYSKPRERAQPSPRRGANGAAKWPPQTTSPKLPCR